MEGFSWNLQLTVAGLLHWLLFVKHEWKSPLHPSSSSSTAGTQPGRFTLPSLRASDGSGSAVYGSKNTESFFFPSSLHPRLQASLSFFPSPWLPLWPWLPSNWHFLRRESGLIESFTDTFTQLCLGSNTLFSDQISTNCQTSSLPVTHLSNFYHLKVMWCDVRSRSGIICRENSSGLTFSSSFVDDPGRDSVHQTQQENAECADPRHLLDVTCVSYA